MLDASAASLILGPAGAAGDFVQVGEGHDRPAADSSENTASATVNTPPSAIQFLNPPNEIAEGDYAILEFKFVDPDKGDTHSVEVDWGDGTIETMTLTMGERNVSARHQYLDDMPTGPSEVPYAVKVTIIDSSQEETSAETKVLVKNVVPKIGFSPVTMINENGEAILQFIVGDPGLADTHEVEIDWGDGTVENFALPTGEWFVITTHQYLDDMPTGPAEISYPISIKVTDDDGGVGKASVSVLVKNVAPSNIEFTPIAMIDESYYAQLQLTFTDPGTLDTHKVEIDWGDGAIDTIFLQNGERQVSASHQYLDDKPTGPTELPYTIGVKIADDDGAIVSANTEVLVKNIVPKIGIAPVAMINEDGEAVLQFIVADPGLVDTHEIEIDWGDGSVEMFTLPVDERFVMRSHKYLDDMPTGPAELAYAINVKVTDDDGGVGTATTSVLVKNVAPMNVQIAPVVTIDENSFAQLHVIFDDPGTLDTHTVEIHWGDGTVDTHNLPVGERMLLANHQYLDDMPTGPTEISYPIKVKVTDDDGGEGTATTSVLVKNVAPRNIQIDPVLSINEDGNAFLKFTFDDPGTLDTHEVKIDWGDGTVETILLQNGERQVMASHQYFDDMPTGPPEISYAISVKVTDDDGGVVTANTSVLTKNVAPSNIQIGPVAMIDENDFAQLYFTFEDPGTLDTHTVEIDWGDGTVSTLSLPTGERMLLVNHQYLDDTPTGPAENSYPINVKVTDDDGGFATAATSVLVKNVAPTFGQLFLTQSQIEEGNFVSISGSFDDQGLLDTHRVFVQWGDGFSEEVAITQLNGSGSFTSPPHFYADNDTVNPDDGPVPDNLYTVVVTAVDDDGGEGTGDIDLKVLNVSPTLDPIIEATDVNNLGETFLTIRFSDPGTDTLTIYVDWGDVRDPSDPSLPAAQPFVIDLTGIDGAGTFTVTLKHTYSGPPNPNSPASDIDIFVYVVDDDSDDAVIADGFSEIRMATIKNPGIGDQPVYIDTTPQVPRLVFPPRIQNFYFEVSLTDEGGRQGSELRAAAGDTQVTTERFFELAVVDAEGNVSQRYRLNSEVLKNLPALFRKLPDNSYEIYLVHTETNTRRLVIAFTIRNSKVIDPGDDSEGTRDRPPTNEVFDPAGDIEETTNKGSESLPETKTEPKANANGAEVEQEVNLPAELISTRVAEPDTSMNWGPAVVGLAATESFRSWAQQVDRTVAQADRQKWRNLRLRNHNSRKNR